MPRAEEPEPKDVSQNEFRELKRVFDYMADFAPKYKLRKDLQPRLDRVAKIQAYYKNPEAVKIVDESGEELGAAVLAAELERLEREIASVQGAIDAIDARPDEVKKIHPRDLQQALAFLGKHTEKKEIDDMIWEVDENLDGCVDWTEFSLMFRRNITDKSGLEPTQLFNVVQFLMYDKDFSGEVSVVSPRRVGKRAARRHLGARARERKTRSAHARTARAHAQRARTRAPDPPRARPLTVNRAARAPANPANEGRDDAHALLALRQAAPRGRNEGALRLEPLDVGSRAGGAAAPSCARFRCARTRARALTLTRPFAAPP